jgi:O-antigen/teichoic acid export membrane protein
LLSLKQRAIRGAFWASAENWSRQFISLVIFMVLARILAPTEIGLYAIVTIVITLTQIFLDSGVGEAIVQRRDLEPEHIDAGFWGNMGLSVLLAGSAALLAGTISDLFGEPALGELIPVASLIILIGSLSSTQQALLKRNLDFRTLAIRTVASVLISGAVGITMALTSFGVWALAGHQITERTVSAVILWWSSDWRPRRRLSWHHARDLLPYSSHMIGSQALVFVQHQVDRFVIGLVLGPAVLGVYSLAVKILDSFASMLFNGTANASFATFTKLQGHPERQRDALFLISRFSSIVGFPCFVGLAVTAPDLIHMVFGTKWEGAAEILQVLALTGIPWLLATNAGTVTRSAGQSGWYLTMTAASVGLKVVLLLALTGQGLYALTVAFTLGDYAMIPAFILATKLVVPMRTTSYLRCFADALLGCALMAGAVIALQAALPQGLDAYVRFILSALAGAAVYSATVAAIAWPTVKNMTTLIAMRGAAQSS